MKENWFTWDSGLGEDEFKRRMERIRRGMQRRNLDALIIYTSPREFPNASGHVRYVSNWSGDRDRGSSLVILPAEGHPELIINSENYMPMAKEASWIKAIRVMKSSLGVEAKNSLGRSGIKKGVLGLVGSNEMTKDEYDGFQKALIEYDLRKSEEVLDEVRLVKSSNEIELHRKTAQICDEAFEGFKRFAKPRVREYEAWAEMEYIAARRGVEKSGCTIASGPYVGQQPVTPRARKFEKNDLVIVSSVFRFRGYWAQVIRTGSIGKSSGRGEEIFNLISEAQKQGIKALKPGDTLMKVYESISDVMNPNGHEKQNHIHFRLGHGMGLSYAEKPGLIFHSLLPDYDIKVQSGMVIEIHPNILLSDQVLGAALGDLCLVTDNGAESLTKAEREFFAT